MGTPVFKKAMHATLGMGVRVTVKTFAYKYCSMNLLRFVLLLISMSLFSCMEADPASSTTDSKNVRIEIDGVVIGPGKVNQALWDCCGSVDQATWQSFVQLASVTGLVTLSAPAAELLRYVTNLTAAALSAPEPYGTASIDLGEGYVLPIDLTGTTEDTFIASFAGPGWTKIQLNSNIRIKVDIYDRDLANPDLIGTAILTPDDIQLALDNKRVIDVYVGNQTNNQLLFVKISANYVQ